MPVSTLWMWHRRRWETGEGEIIPCLQLLNKGWLGGGLKHIFYFYPLKIGNDPIWRLTHIFRIGCNHQLDHNLIKSKEHQIESDWDYWLITIGNNICLYNSTWCVRGFETSQMVQDFVGQRYYVDIMPHSIVTHFWRLAVYYVVSILAFSSDLLFCGG